MALKNILSDLRLGLVSKKTLLSKYNNLQQEHNNTLAVNKIKEIYGRAGINQQNILQSSAVEYLNDGRYIGKTFKQNSSFNEIEGLRKYIPGSADQNISTIGQRYGRLQPTLYTTYFSLHSFYTQSMILRTIIPALIRQILRRGWTFKPRYKTRCLECNNKYQKYTADDYCPHCGGELREPDPKQKEALEEFLKGKVNRGDQYFYDILYFLLEDWEVFDDNWIVIDMDYQFDGNGKLIKKLVKGINRAMPGTDIQIFTDQKGDRGGKWFCLTPEHRKTLYDKPGMCPICKHELFEACYMAGEAHDFPLCNLECQHSSKYHPSKTYGFSLVFTAFENIMTLVFQEKVLRTMYEEGRIRSMVFVNTSNYDELQRAVDSERNKLVQDPNHTVIIAVPSESGRGKADVVNMGLSPLEIQWLEQRKEMRERVAALYGVLNLMMGDTSASGGLNNESQQLEFFSDTIESAQRICNEKILGFIGGVFGLTDYSLVLVPNESQKQRDEWELKNIEVDYALKMKTLGFKVELSEEGEGFNFREYTPEERQELMSQFQQSQQNLGNNINQNNINGNESNQSNGNGYTPEEKGMIQEMTEGLKKISKGFEGGASNMPLESAVNALASTPEISEESAKTIGDQLQVDWNTVDLKQFTMGLKIELEHTDVTGGDLMTTGKIALAHLKEDPKYYSKLKQMEQK